MSPLWNFSTLAINLLRYGCVVEGPREGSRHVLIGDNFWPLTLAHKFVCLPTGKLSTLVAAGQWLLA